MNANMLVGKIMENGYTIRDISILLGIERHVLVKKLDNIDRLTVGEAKVLKYTLGLSNTEAVSIFFGERCI